MSSGGGKSGKNTEQTDRDIPDWLKQPAIRNLQRAEDVQRIEYMPYRGAEIAAFNDVQNLAMNNNLATAKAFGLLAPDSTLTAESQMPTPTEFDGGFKGYSSMSLYDQALAETKAQQPGAVAQYEALFGAPAMQQLNAMRGSGGGIRSTPVPTSKPRDLTYAEHMAERYRNTKVGEDASGNSIYGYTGQGNQSRAGNRTLDPIKVNYDVQADKGLSMQENYEREAFGGKR